MISVVMPVYNGERFLALAVDSILAQTFRDLELIVVDDGSTDGTPAVVRTFGARVRCVTQPNAGLAAARNRGLAAATAELVAFLDADDLWLPAKIACQMERFRARPELEVSLTHIQNFWADDRPVAAEEGGTHSMEPMPGYSSPTMLARRSVFARVGPYDAALRTAACRDWFIRAREQNAVFDLLAQVMVRRRLHRTNMSRQPGKVDDYARLVKRHLDRRRGRIEAR